jgi:cytochrome P450
MTIAEAVATPVLIGPVPPKKQLSLFKFLKVVRENFMAAIPITAYEQPISAMKFGIGHVVLVADPDGVKRVLLDNVANYPKAEMEKRMLGAALGEGLLVSDGEKWRSHRRLMAPSFDHKSIVSYAPGMVESAALWLERWDSAGSGATIDIAQEMTGLTLKIISRAMFSTDSDGISDLMGDTLKHVADQLDFGLPDAIPLVRNLRMRGRFARIAKIFEKLDRAIYALIDERAARPVQGSPDLLDRLIAARDGETGVKLSDREVRDEVVIIFVAGHETTSIAMTFAWYLLSQHPREEAKLHAELDSVLGGRLPVYEDLARLPYSRMVIEEAMRLYPPAPGLSNREPQAADVLSGRPISRKDTIIVVPWVLHRHRALWDDPDRFDPERFSPERSQGRHRFAYLPFGGGPRICIGASLAMTEAQLILATMAQLYRLTLAPGQNIQLQHRVTLRPRDGMKMVLERREKRSA